jgi:glutamine synthetase
MRLMKYGRNQMLEDGKISDSAKRAIAGMMKLAPSITAFGNMNPTSYFRLVPHQEAPTNVCWGDRNRSVLVRVPLGWTAKADLCRQANPRETAASYDTAQKQTVEMRSPDASANVYLLMASLAVACRYGFSLENGVEVAESTYVNVNIHKKENEKLLESLDTLPDSCAASADCLERQRAVYEESGVFSGAVIDGILSQLRAFDDRTLRRDISNDPDKVSELVRRHFYCG